jgi:hypothetical protein
MEKGKRRGGNEGRKEKETYLVVSVSNRVDALEMVL